MAHKITLYTDKELIEEIKRYARRHQTSVSKLVHHFFKGLVEREKKQYPHSEITESLTGILEDSDEKDYRKYLEKRYL